MKKVQWTFDSEAENKQKVQWTFDSEAENKHSASGILRKSISNKLFMKKFVDNLWEFV